RQALAVGAESHAGNAADVPPQDELLAGGKVPDPDSGGPLLDSDEGLAILAKADEPRPRMFQDGDLAIRRDLPQSDDIALIMRKSHLLVVRTKADGMRVPEARKIEPLNGGPRKLQHGTSRIAPIGQVLAGAAEGEVVDPPSIRGEVVLERAVGDLPNQDPVPVIARGQELAVRAQSQAGQPLGSRRLERLRPGLVFEVPQGNPGLGRAVGDQGFAVCSQYNPEGRNVSVILTSWAVEGNCPRTDPAAVRVSLPDFDHPAEVSGRHPVAGGIKAQADDRGAVFAQPVALRPGRQVAQQEGAILQSERPSPGVGMNLQAADPAGNIRPRRR